ncbi:MAG: UDP-N-acetylmuramate dehydrogenase [Verrucomicrobia bacterium]|nr:UDP-N-acetylmuramate dehydrogenase [Verrucomicrobiota bacterium]
MNLASEIQTLFPKLPIRENKPLADCTTFQLGGPCPLLIDNPSADQLPALVQKLNEQEMPFLVIGQGSNLVISDRGLDCAVIRFCSDKPKIEAHENRVTVSGDTLLDDLALFTIENEIGDLTYCSGIPGTVGGGIAGNAGAFGRQMGDHLTSAEILGLDGTVRSATPADLEFAYRHSKLKETGEIVLSATFELPMVGKKEMQAERERILEFRKEHHPDWHATPCAGSVFRNIEATSAAERRQAAGHFLEDAGAKAMTVGGAKIFEKHANIIIGGVGCTAQNVWDLSEQMIRAVQKKFDLELVREVRFLGKFS